MIINQNKNVLTTGVILILLMITFPVFSQIITVERRLDFWKDMGQSIFVQGDFDNDGNGDFLIDVQNKTGIIIGEIKNNLLKTKYTCLSQPDNKFYKFFYIDSNFDEEKELYGISKNNKIYRLSLPELNKIDSFETTLAPSFIIQDIIFTDHDQDGVFNWAVISSNMGAYLLNSINFQVEAELGDSLHGHHIFIGNFDADAENEICLYTLAGVQLVNMTDFTIEKTIENITDYAVVDFEHDSVFKVLYLDNNEVLVLYDHTIGNTTFSIDIEDTFLSKIFIGDIDNDNQEEIVLYSNITSSYRTAILTTSPTEINPTIKFGINPYMSAGTLLGKDNLLSPESQGLLYLNNSEIFISIDYESDKELERTYSTHTPSVEIFDYLWDENVKSIGINVLEEWSGGGSRKIFLISYDSFNLQKQILPEYFYPETNSTSFHNSINTFRQKGQKFYDVVLQESYSDNLTFYSPPQNKKYNEYRFSLENFFFDDIDYDGKPEILSLNTDADVISIKEFSSKESYKELISIYAPSSYSSRFWALQTDEDRQKEIAHYGLGSSQGFSIFDSETGMPTSLSGIAGVSELFSYQAHDNSFRFYGIKGQSFFIYDIAQQEMLVETDVPISMKKVVYLPIHEAGEVTNYFVTYGSQLVILNEDGELIENSETFSQHWTSLSKIYIHDTDNDGKANVLTSFEDGILDFEINLPGNYYQPFHLTDNFPSDYSVQSKNTPILLVFDRAVTISALLDNVSFSSALTGDIPFTIEEISTFQFALQSTIDFESNDTITVTVSNALTSKAFFHFDGNYNERVDNNESDDFHFSFRINDTEAIAKPEISWIVPPLDTFYANTKQYLRFKVTDTNNSEIPINSCYGGFKEDFMAGTQKSFYPIDSVFDNSTETVSVLLNTFGKPSGVYEFQIIASNYAQVESDTFIVPISIVTEKGIPFKRDGGDALNIFSQQNDTITSVFELNWHLDLSANGFWHDYRVVGEGDYIYFSETHSGTFFFHKININTGEEIWEKEIEGSAVVASPVLDNGIIYFQTYGGHAKLVALRAVDGEVLWKTPFRGQNVKPYSPVIVDNFILMSGGKFGGLYCFDRWTGCELWYNDMEQPTDWSPSVFEGIVYGIAAGELKAFELNSGNLLWKHDYGSNFIYNINNSLIIDTINNTAIYTSTTDVSAINLATHSLVWSTTIYWGKSLSSLYNNNLYVYKPSKLYQINPLTGEILQQKTLTDTFDDMFIAGGKIILSGENIEIYDSETFALRSEIEGVNGLISTIDDKLIVSRNEDLWLFNSVDVCFDYHSTFDTICHGGIYEFLSVDYAEPGIFIDTLINESSCHEIHNLHLFVREEVTLIGTSIIPDNGTENGVLSVSFSGGEEPYVYEWNTEDSTAIIENLAQGIYSLTISDVQGCEKEYSFEIDLFCFDYQNTIDTICFGESYSFSSYEFTESIIFSDTTFYEFTCDEVHNLDLTVQDEITLIDTIINAEIGIEYGSISVFFLGGQPPYTYLWNTGDTTATIENLPAGIYSLTVSDDLDCEREYNFEVNLIIANHNEKISLFHLFPNPVQSGSSIFITKSNLAPLIKKVVIKNTLGQSLSVLRSTTHQPIQEIPIHMNAGIFWIEFFSEEGDLLGVSKIVVTTE